MIWQINAFRTKCHIAFALKKYDEAKSYALKILQLDKSQTSLLTATLAFEFSARLAAIENNYPLSAALFHKAQQIRAAQGMPVPNSEKDIIRNLEGELREQLGEAELRKTEAAIQDLSLREAIVLCNSLLRG